MSKRWGRGYEEKEVLKLLALVQREPPPAVIVFALLDRVAELIKAYTELREKHELGKPVDDITLGMEYHVTEV